MAVQPVFTHPWDVLPAEARTIQNRLREQVCVRPLERQPRAVAGVDVSVKGGVAKAAVVLLSYPDLVPFQAATAALPVSFPYVPGLLAFREGPVVFAALEQLTSEPDVLMFDAQGLAHPRRMGLATHLGILLDMPAVGCAKSRLCGREVVPGEEKGSWTPLEDRGEVIGAVVRTRSRVRPVYVSIGHRTDLETAVSLVLSCTTKYRLPEPTRWAHRVAGGEALTTS
ncbi:MAG: deoxyribonuclease V [Anaerolineae bacterium]|nr:deoxyribonuclease V [Anaerolineae bacterium]